VADPRRDETFRVIDRRHFTEEGDRRKDVPEDVKAEEAPASKAANASQPIPQEPGNVTHGAGNRTSIDAGTEAAGTANHMAPPDAAGIAAPQPAEQAGSRPFQMLVDFLTRNAAAMLGGMADPRTGQPFLDLEGAREMIDMLDALREKTKGNLAKVDDDLLIEVIGSLKLTFMEISNAAAEQMQKQAKIKP